MSELQVPGAVVLLASPDAEWLEASKQFRRVNGFLHLPALRDALNRHITVGVTPPCDDEDVAA